MFSKVRATTTVCWPLEVTSIQLALVGCQELSWKVKVKAAQSCQTICHPMDYTIHGILQARILEWVAFPFFRGSSQPRDRTQVFHIAGRFFTSWATGKPRIQARGCKFKHVEGKDWTWWIQSSKKNLAGETGVWVGILVSFSVAIQQPRTGFQLSFPP